MGGGGGTCSVRNKGSRTVRAVFEIIVVVVSRVMAMGRGGVPTIVTVRFPITVKVNTYGSVG
jgi:hypothetical protein